MLTEPQMAKFRAKHPELTDAQIRSLYTPDTSPRSPLGRFNAAKAEGRNVTMTDIISEIASEDAGRPMRYVAGALVRVK